MERRGSRVSGVWEPTRERAIDKLVYARSISSRVSFVSFSIGRASVFDEWPKRADDDDDDDDAYVAPALAGFPLSSPLL